MTFLLVAAAIALIQQSGCGNISNDARGKSNFADLLLPRAPEIPAGYPAVPVAKDGKPKLLSNEVYIPLIPQVRASCSGNKLGFYTWGYDTWNDGTSPIIDFLRNQDVSDFSCGEIYINVADYSASTYIRDEYALVPFIRNVRATGNHETVFLVYGDVQVSAHAPNGPTDFAETFFRWIASISDADLQAVLPLGLSYDCEHVSHTTIEDALTRAQQLKSVLVRTRLGGDASRVTIEWTIEGEKKPVDTDIVMKLSDRALMMGYRNHIGRSVRDPDGVDNIITRLMNFMFTEQCQRCMDDDYAQAHYKAKIKLMFEADCECGASCHKISFCAYDAAEELWGRRNHLGQSVYKNGAEYMEGTMRETERQLRNLMTPAQFRRLFGETRELSLFVVHNWSWFTCYFQNPSVAIKKPFGSKQQTCKNYAALASSCRRSK